MRILIAITAALLIFLPVSGEAQTVKRTGKSVVNEPDVFKVGLVLPLSGNDKRLAGDIKEAVILAQNEVNNPPLEAVGDSTKLEVVTLDSGESPKEIGDVVRRLVRDYGVSALIVGGSRNISLAIQHFSVMYELPIIFTNLFGDDLPEENKLLFSTFPPSEALDQVIQKFFGIYSDTKTVNSFLVSGEPGLSLDRAVNRAANNLGLKVYSNIWEAASARDLRVDVLKMQGRQEKQLIYLGAAFPFFVGWLKSYNYFPPTLLTYEAIPLLDQGELDPALVEGFYLANWKIDNSLIEKFRKDYQRQVTAEVAAGYDAVKAIGVSIDSNRKRFREKLVNVDITASLGQLNFNHRGARRDSHGMLYQIIGGVLKEIE